MKLKRSYDNRIVTGVLGGIAERFGWNANVLRIIWIIFTLFTFPLGIIIYTVLWIVIPLENPNGFKDVTNTKPKITPFQFKSEHLKKTNQIAFKISSLIWTLLFIAGALFLWFRKEDAAGVTNTMGYRLTNLLIEWIPLFLVILFVHLAWYHYLLKK